MSWELPQFSRRDNGTTPFPDRTAIFCSVLSSRNLLQVSRVLSVGGIRCLKLRCEPTAQWRHYGIDCRSCWLAAAPGLRKGWAFLWTFAGLGSCSSARR